MKRKNFFIVFAFLFCFFLLSPGKIFAEYDNACIENKEGQIDNGARDQKCLTLTTLLSQAWYEADKENKSNPQYSEWGWDYPASKILQGLDELKTVGKIFLVAEKKDYVDPLVLDTGWEYLFQPSDIKSNFLGFMKSGLTNINWAVYLSVALLENTGYQFDFYPRAYVGEEIVSILNNYLGYSYCSVENLHLTYLNQMISTLKVYQGLNKDGGNFSAIADSDRGLNHSIFQYWNRQDIWLIRADWFYRKLREFASQYPEYAFMMNNLVGNSTSVCAQRKYTEINLQVELLGLADYLKSTNGFRIKLGENDLLSSSSLSSFSKLIDLKENQLAYDFEMFTPVNLVLSKNNVYLDLTNNGRPSLQDVAVNTVEAIGENYYRLVFDFKQNNILKGNLYLKLNENSLKMSKVDLLLPLKSFDQNIQQKTPIELKENQPYSIIIPKWVSEPIGDIIIWPSTENAAFYQNFPVSPALIDLQRDYSKPLNLSADLRLNHLRVNTELVFDNYSLNNYRFYELFLGNENTSIFNAISCFQGRQRILPSTNKMTFDFYPSVALFGKSTRNYLFLRLSKIDRSEFVHVPLEEDFSLGTETILNIKKDLKPLLFKGKFNFTTSDRISKTIRELNLYFDLNEDRTLGQDRYYPRGENQFTWMYSIPLDSENLYGLAPDTEIDMKLSVEYEPGEGQYEKIWLKKLKFSEIQNGNPQNISLHLERPVLVSNINYLFNDAFPKSVSESFIEFYDRYDNLLYSNITRDSQLGVLISKIDGVVFQDLEIRPLLYLRRTNSQRKYVSVAKLYPEEDKVIFNSDKEEKHQNLTYDLRCTPVKGKITILSGQKIKVNPEVPISFYLQTSNASLKGPETYFEYLNNIQNGSMYEVCLIPGDYKIELKNESYDRPGLDYQKLSVGNSYQSLNQDLTFDVAERKLSGKVILKDSLLKEKVFTKFKLLLYDDRQLVPYSDSEYTEIEENKSEYPYSFNNLKVGHYQVSLTINNSENLTVNNPSLPDKLVISENDFEINRDFVFGTDEPASCTLSGGQCSPVALPDLLPLIFKEAKAYVYEYATEKKVNLGKKDDCPFLQSCYMKTCSNPQACQTSASCLLAGGFPLGELNCGSGRICCGDPFSYPKIIGCENSDGTRSPEGTRKCMLGDRAVSECKVYEFFGSKSYIWTPAALCTFGESCLAGKCQITGKTCDLPDTCKSVTNCPVDQRLQKRDCRGDTLCCASIPVPTQTLIPVSACHTNSCDYAGGVCTGNCPESQNLGGDYGCLDSCGEPYCCELILTPTPTSGSSFGGLLPSVKPTPLPTKVPTPTLTPVPTNTPTPLPQFSLCGNCEALGLGCPRPNECRVVNDAALCAKYNQNNTPCCLWDTENCRAGGYTPVCGAEVGKYPLNVIPDYCNKCHRSLRSDPWCTDKWDLTCGAGSPAQPRTKYPPEGFNANLNQTDLSLSWYSFGEGFKRQCGEKLPQTYRKWDTCNGTWKFDSRAQCIPYADGQNSSDRDCWGYVCARGSFGIPTDWRFYEVYVKKPGEENFSSLCKITNIPNPPISKQDWIGTIPDEKKSCPFTPDKQGDYQWYVRAGYQLTTAGGSFFQHSDSPIASFKVSDLNLKAVCHYQENGETLIDLSWDAPQTQTSSKSTVKYALRLNNLSNPDFVSCSNNYSPTGDICLDNLSTNAYSKRITPNQKYSWWIAQVDSANNLWSPSIFGTDFICDGSNIPSVTATTAVKPTPYGECLTCKLFTTSWQELTPPFSLIKGQTLYLATKGSLVNAQTLNLNLKARFRVNGTADGRWCTGAGLTLTVLDDSQKWCETTLKHDDYFYLPLSFDTLGKQIIQSMLFNLETGWY